MIIGLDFKKRGEGLLPSFFVFKYNDIIDKCVDLGAKICIYPTDYSVAIFDKQSNGHEFESVKNINRFEENIVDALVKQYNGILVNTDTLTNVWIGKESLLLNLSKLALFVELTSDEVDLIGMELFHDEELFDCEIVYELLGDEPTFVTNTILNTYIRTGVCEDANIRHAINIAHDKCSAIASDIHIIFA